jgi:hypothetical protein
LKKDAENGDLNAKIWIEEFAELGAKLFVKVE